MSLSRLVIPAADAVAVIVAAVVATAASVSCFIFAATCSVKGCTGRRRCDRKGTETYLIERKKKSWNGRTEENEKV